MAILRPWSFSLHRCFHTSLARLQVIVGKDAIMATPAASAVIRRRKLAGGLIMSASHNPGAPAATGTHKAVQAVTALKKLELHRRMHFTGGPEEDWGIKMNSTAGEPAPERITNEIFKYTESIDTLNMADVPDIDLSSIGSKSFGDFEVHLSTAS